MPDEEEQGPAVPGTAASPHSVTASAHAAAAVLITVAGCFASWPAILGGWIWDDTLDITGNALVRDPHGLWKIWFQPGGLYDYYPLKFSLQWLQWQVWRDITFGYHLTSIVLHLTSALLIWRLLRRLGAHHGWIGALLFAVHPLTVESVAYLSELKNTLSLPLLLLSFNAWLDFDAQRRPRRYALSLALFVASMLSKTSGVMFPGMLLLHAWWQRGRITGRDLRPTLPFFGVSVALGLVTVWFQHQAAIGGETAFHPVGGLLARLLVAGSAIAFYVAKTILPAGLSPVYARWPVEHPSVLVWLAWPVTVALLLWLWRNRSSWGRHVLFGAGWFILFVLPVSGLIAISSQRFTWVMDHLVYLPLIGLLGVVAAGLGWAVDRMAPRMRPMAVGGVIVGAGVLAAMSHAHAEIFTSEEALWTGAVYAQPGSAYAHFALGNWRRQQAKPKEALVEYDQALRLEPGLADAHYNRANTLRESGRLDEAVAAYRAALRYRPALYVAYGNLAIVLAQQGHPDEALAACEQALKLNPSYAEARLNAGLLLARGGRANEAISQFEALLRTHPDSIAAQFNLGNALLAGGRAAEALPHYEHAAALSPHQAQIQAQLARTLAQLGRPDEAQAHYARARQLDPTLPAQF